MSTKEFALSSDARAKIADQLNRLLADSYTLYLKTHNYHWNVTGPHFGSLHTLFETQYSELALAVDEIAERIRALGHRSPGSYAEFGRLTGITEASGQPNALEMVGQLAGDNETCAASAAKAFAAADEVGDQPTADLAVTRQQLHEKSAWMLRSFLE